MAQTKHEKTISAFVAKWHGKQTSNEMSFKEFVSDFKKAVKAACVEQGIDKSQITFNVGYFKISGFIKTPENASAPYVYFSTWDTRSPINTNDFMFRTAQHERDFKGGCNHFGGLRDMVKFALD